jgi:hypothetical protein
MSESNAKIYFPLGENGFLHYICDFFDTTSRRHVLRVPIRVHSMPKWRIIFSFWTAHTFRQVVLQAKSHVSHQGFGPAKLVITLLLPRLVQATSFKEAPNTPRKHSVTAWLTCSHSVLEILLPLLLRNYLCRKGIHSSPNTLRVRSNYDSQIPIAVWLLCEVYNKQRDRLPVKSTKSQRTEVKNTSTRIFPLLVKILNEFRGPLSKSKLWAIPGLGC